MRAFFLSTAVVLVFGASVVDAHERGAIDFSSYIRGQLNELNDNISSVDDIGTLNRIERFTSALLKVLNSISGMSNRLFEYVLAGNLKMARRCLTKLVADRKELASLLHELNGGAPLWSFAVLGSNVNDRNADHLRSSAFFEGTLSLDELSSQPNDKLRELRREVFLDNDRIRDSLDYIRTIIRARFEPVNDR